MKKLQFEDAEFGAITVRCNPRAKRVILRVVAGGEVRITIPHQRHMRMAERLLNDARQRIRQQRREMHGDEPRYQPGMMIGRAHQLVAQAHAGENVSARVSGDRIVVKYPMALSWDSARLQAKVHEAAKKALRREAQEFLPPRLARLAREWEFTYKSLRISSGHTRWGSCSSDDTISLNLWLMSLPDSLIDYVICHELCHTRQHNHSAAFWDEVARLTPGWRELRKTLKAHHPY